MTKQKSKKSVKSEKKSKVSKDDDLKQTKMHVDGRVGPISKKMIKRLFSTGKINLTTYFWASGMTMPKQLWEIRELRLNLIFIEFLFILKIIDINNI